MGNSNELTHQQKKERLLELIDLTGFTFLGFEVFLKYKSEGKYMSAIKSGNKIVSKFLPKKIEDAFGFEEGTFFDLTKEFDQEKIQGPIKKFLKNHSKADISKYLATEKEHVMVIKRLIKEDFFNTKRTSQEILQKFEELGYFYTSNDLSYKLVNLAKVKMLQVEKSIKTLKSGEEGDRPINHYWVKKERE
ncbi:hypothetical protein [Algoriphagus yeomjeoni]|uniref:Uncharacterized protein n=1 Tax=Algoriphagus yeomjeoni TaxID=291403 RepID=A0A327P6L1_9BACT|nr:hypothetical protein [Algoriphagus yeomjeoni]RAI86724.1 hypothetical protein LV83_03280 [Algoriphagus yeomjeoni]